MSTAWYGRLIKMQTGRKPKPTAIKVLEGNRGKRAINKAEPKPSLSVSSAKPPVWLNKDARKEWARLASELDSQNLLTSWDVQSFAAYCNAVAMVMEAKRHLTTPEDYVQATPNGFEQASPWVGILEKWTRQMVSIGGLLGLNPSERGRLNVRTAAKDGRSAAEKAFGLTAGG